MSMAPSPHFAERPGNLIEAKVADNDVRQGHEYAWDGGGQAYRDALVQGFSAARDNGPERRPAGLADPGRANPEQWCAVDPASLSERPRQVYETTLGADERTSAFATVNGSPTWDPVDGPMLQAFTSGTAPADGVYQVQPSGQGGRRRSNAEINEGRR